MPSTLARGIPCVSALIHAQQTTGFISGLVRNATGAALPNAERTGRSNDNGDSAVNGVDVGQHRITIHHARR